MIHTVTTRLTRGQIRVVLNSLPREVQVDVRVMERAGLAVLTRIREAFLVKSAGGTDDAGQRWVPLKPSTLAHRSKWKRGKGRSGILRDTGALLRSLTPGGGSSDQILRTERGAVIIGTSRRGAAIMHRGSRRIPKRPLWPEPSQWPTGWWADVVEAIVEGVVEAITKASRGGR